MNTKTEKVKKTETVADRKPRKKVYERIRESSIPEELVEHFKKQNYDLKLIRYLLHGEEDYRYLYRRKREGYEFVTKKEVPEEFMDGFSLINTKSCQGLITVGDLCLVKVDSDLRKSRRDFFKEETERHIDAVDVHVLEKKGFRNLGTRTKVTNREPSFQE